MGGAVTQSRRTVMGPGWLRCGSTIFVLGGKYQLFRALISHRRGRHKACKVRVQTFQAELRLDFACHYRCWPTVGSIWIAGAIFWYKYVIQKINYFLRADRGYELYIIMELQSGMFWSKRGNSVVKDAWPRVWARLFNRIKFYTN